MDRGRNKKMGLNLPSGLVSQLEGDSFNNAEWQKSHNLGGKRKSRKESRKEFRQNKRMKRMPTRARESQREQPRDSNKVQETPEPAKKKPSKPVKSDPSAEAKKRKTAEISKPFMSAHELEMRRRDEEDAKYYAKKLGLKSLKLKGDDDGLGDILGDLDVDEFGMQSEEDPEDEASSLSEDDSSEEDMSAGETMAKLAALKAKKANAQTNKDSKSNASEGIRIVAEDDLGASDDSFDEDGFGSGSDSSDGGDMTAEETMAKLAALKAKKSGSKTIEKNRDAGLEEDDLLNSSDFESDDDSDDEAADEDMTAEETMAKLAALKGKRTPDSVPGADDDSLSEGDFDDSDEEDSTEMTAEETMRKLAALKQAKNGNTAGAESESEPVSESESEDDDNPYLPPSRRNHDAAQEDDHTSQKPAVAERESAIKMRRIFKGSLNRLTESTFNPVVNEIELAFSRNSRAESSEVLTEQILENISGSQPLQHSIFVVYAGLIAALYRSIGISFAASFVQSLVEGIMKQSESTNNFLTLLVECYSLHIVSSRLLYDIVKDFLHKIVSTESENYVEQILVIVRNGGSLLRTDDPLALKEVILILQQRIKELGGTEALPPRMRFLVDTIVALKNNRQKPISELVVALRHRIRKFLQSSTGGSSTEPLQVGLGDIMNSNSKGKWWLVGASWKGSQAGDNKDAEEALPLEIDEENFGEATPDWLELAKKQRLNTDVRRAVFVALMGAEDYLDACLRIDKLGLKNKQERDIPHVILHCLGQEPVYNPYYALVAGKQCTRHSTRKTFQFRLFDWLDSEPNGDTQLAMHYGRFYASLVLQKVLGLDILKAVDFLGASGDVQVFLEIFFVTLYRELGKQAEKDAKKHFQQGLGRVDGKVERDGRELTLLLSKSKEEKVLRGIQLVARSVSTSEAIRNERDRERIVWCAELASDMVDELVKRGGVESI